MINMMWRGCAAAAVALGVVSSGGSALAQQKTEISLSRQPGIFYMPTHIIEKQKLIEKHAAALGLPNITTKWITFSGGGAQTDALLAGGVDILNTGTGNLLLLWDRTRGGVKGIVACSAQPMTLISRDPNIKSLKDYRPQRQDRGADGEDFDPGHRTADRRGGNVRRRPVVETGCQYRAARPSRCLCGAVESRSTKSTIISRFRPSPSSN